jgi:catechol 2,3-dioxygenase-like lactoylglutathione lyase family enzyme
MATIETGSEHETRVRGARTVDTKLEVVTIPVSDIDRAKRFYEGLGWRLDADFKGEGWRAVQLTPPGSPCSIHLGTDAAPGSAQGMFLVVDDIEAARSELNARGADVSEPFHFAGIKGPKLSGADPERGSYKSYAELKDPDGNGWVLQEVGTRLPGRGLALDVRTLTELLREAEQAHGAYQATAPKHHWSDWYAAYIIAREQGRTPDEATTDAGRHMDGRF